MQQVWTVANQILLFLILVVLSVKDCQSKSVPVWLLLPPALSGLLSLWLFAASPLYNLLGTALLFLLLFLLVKITGGALGLGDALAFLPIGFVCGIVRSFEILFLSVALAAVLGAALLLLHRAHRKTTLPFYPFFTAVYTVFLFLDYVPEVVK